MTRPDCVKRLAEEAYDNGWTLVVCSTSALSSVEAVLNHVMGEETAGKFAGVFAGDMVKPKKPAPDIYNLAVEKLGVDPADCWSWKTRATVCWRPPPG
ncbi:MAG: HAD hydrolase-like protein [Chloroflexota bacterium]